MPRNAAKDAGRVMSKPSNMSTKEKTISFSSSFLRQEMDLIRFLFHLTRKIKLYRDEN